jgi:hypothetical protein
LLILVVLVAVTLPLQTAHALASEVTVSVAHLPDYYSRPITQNQTAEILVGVNSTYPVVSVTLFYAVVGGDVVPNGYQYKPIGMSFGWGTKTNGTYFTIMPKTPNNTWVWAFAVAVDAVGNSGGSQDNSRRVYYSWTPDPKASTIDFNVLLGHIDPKQLTLNMSISARLTNYASWSPELLRMSILPGYLTVNKDEGGFTFSSDRQTALVYYTSGYPELYPFDGYNFTFTVELPKYLNASKVRFDGMLLEAFRPYPDIIWSDALSLQERLDNNAWSIHSYIEFRPSHNFTSALPEMEITVVLDRKPDPVNYLLLYPIVSLYALLGFSVLLRGKDEVRNRLLVYLNVFVFSYGFQSSIRNLPITPLMTGLSMIERIALALIPCTVILAFVSILTKALTESLLGTFSRSNDPPGLALSSALDTVAIAVSEIVLYLIAMVTVQYTSTAPSYVYTLADLNWWGYATAILLSLGLCISLIVTGFHICRANSVEPKLNRPTGRAE